MKILLKQVRERRNITLINLAIESGVSKSQINDIENEKSVPTIVVLCKLAKALQVPITELFNCEE